MKYLLSVIVPIKNNYHFIKSIINKTIEMKDEQTELVIQDNTEDNTEIKEYLNLLDVHFIKYNHCPNTLSMTENFNRGLLNSTGRYVCILGADDNISSKILSVAKYLEKQGYESAIFHKAIYNWPGMKFRAHRKRPSLIIPKCTGKVQEIDVQRELYKQLRLGMTSLGKLPEPYHGIVKREALEKVFSLTGSFVPGACPDMAMAVALTQVIRRHIFIDAPISISGQSYNSAGGKGARGEHKGLLKNISFLPEDIEEKWPEKIPKIWTGPTIYADSAHSALIALEKEEMIQNFNYMANYADLLSYYPEYRGLLKPLFKNNSIRLYSETSLYLNKTLFMRLKAYIKNWIMVNLHLSKDAIYYGIETSFEASKVVDNYINTCLLQKEYLNAN